MTSVGGNLTYVSNGENNLHCYPLNVRFARFFFNLKVTYFLPTFTPKDDKIMNNSFFGKLNFLPSFDEYYRLLFPPLALLFDDVSGW